MRSRKEMKFDALTVAIADASVRADGSMQFKGDRKIAMNFEVSGRQPEEAAGYLA